MQQPRTAFGSCTLRHAHNHGSVPLSGVVDPWVLGLFKTVLSLRGFCGFQQSSGIWAACAS